MPRKTTPQVNNFSSGEISEDFYGRVDLSSYKTGCQICENMLNLPQGPATNRPGTYFVNETENSAEASRLIPFIQDATTFYILEFGDLYIRVYRDHTRLGAPYEIVTTYDEADLNEIQYTQVGNTMYLVHPSYKPQKLTCTSDIVWSIGNYAPTADPFTTADNYPSVVFAFEKRLGFAATNDEPHSIWMSKSGDMDDMTIAAAAADDGIKYTLASPNRIRWIVPQKVLMAGTQGEEFIINGNGLPLAANALPTVERHTAHGSMNLQAVLMGSSVVFVERDTKRVRELSFRQEYESFQAFDTTFFANHIAGDDGFVAMALQQDPEMRVWYVRDDGEIALFLFDKLTQTLGWCRIVTDGEFESVAIIPSDGEDEIWVIVKRTVDGSDVRYVEYFKPRDWGSDDTDIFYVDSGITWDGGAAKTITDATQADPVVITTSAAHGLSDGDFVKITDIVGMTELNNTTYMIKNPNASDFELYLTDGVSTVDGTGLTAYVSGGEASEVIKTMSGLDHLEGEAVVAITDGAPHPACTVSSGDITLQDYYNKIHAGLAYTGKVQPMFLGQGRIVRVTEVFLRFYKTRGCKIGPDEDNLETIYFRKTTDPMDAPPPLYSSHKTSLFQGDYEKEGNILIVQDQPQPLTILMIIPDVGVYE